MAQIISTKDGSNTLFIPELNETYHSIHGAYQESLHVFIKNGIQQIPNTSEITVLEVGFGTGLNAILACEYASKNQQKINYCGLEKFPISYELSSQLGYENFLTENGKSEFTQMHTSDWNSVVHIHPFFTFEKKNQALQEFKNNRSYDLIFFDAFAPEKQPEMWTEEVFRFLYNALKQNGILTTYCAKGHFKRTLKAVGFEVKALPGPPGKREMTIAIKR